jgi:membrane protein YdbS with pleckstrin-like domain
MIQFNGQRPRETVRLVAHQHPLVLLHDFMWSGAWLLLAIGAFSFLNRGIVLSILLIAGPLAALVHLVISLYCWRNTLVLVSTERVAFFHQRGLFKREFYECPLGTIAQVSHKVEGPLQTLFGFGTVIVNTGDAESSVTIKQVPDPFDIQQEIQNVLAGE